jgi:hypothetical protein
MLVDPSPLPSTPALIPGFTLPQELNLCPCPSESPLQVHFSSVTSAMPMATIVVNIPSGTTSTQGQITCCNYVYNWAVDRNQLLLLF